MDSEVRTVVLRAAGTNCDVETDYSFRLAGSYTDLIHVNEIIRGKKSLSDYHILAIPGGFTYGDDVAAGKILANELRYKFGKQLEDFCDSGKIVIGICNGFQVLVKTGLLPDISGNRIQESTLTYNDSGKFEDRWVYMKRDPKDKCIFTQGIEGLIYLPVAHAEGKFVPRDNNMLEELKGNGQIVLRYVDKDGMEASYPWNPNGSIDNVAGISDRSGRIFGIMPHPERHIFPHHHPHWTREKRGRRGDGFIIFENAVEFVRSNLL